MAKTSKGRLMFCSFIELYVKENGSTGRHRYGAVFSNNWDGMDGPCVAGRESFVHGMSASRAKPYQMIGSIFRLQVSIWHWFNTADEERAKEFY